LEADGVLGKDDHGSWKQSRRPNFAVCGCLDPVHAVSGVKFAVFVDLNVAEAEPVALEASRSVCPF